MRKDEKILNDQVPGDCVESAVKNAVEVETGPLAARDC